MVGWHHGLNEQEFEQIPGGCKGQGSRVCCSPWGCKESDMTQQLNNNGLPWWLSGLKKKSACNAGSCRRHGFNPWVRKIPGGGHNLLQYSCLENLTAEETGGLLPIVSQRVRHDLRNLAHTHMYYDMVILCLNSTVGQLVSGQFSLFFPSFKVRLSPSWQVARCSLSLRVFLYIFILQQYMSYARFLLQE